VAKLSARILLALAKNIRVTFSFKKIFCTLDNLDFTPGELVLFSPVEKLLSIMMGALGYIRNHKTEEKIHPKPQNRKKNSPKTVKNRYNGVSGACRSNYTNTDFIKVFVNVMDLSEAFVSFSFSLPFSFSL